MQSQLTLRLDERLIEQAKPLTPIVRRLRGALLDTSVNRETYREHLREKY